MQPNLPLALTWGTASTAVVSAALLACVGCLVPGSPRQATQITTARPSAGTAAPGSALRSPAFRRGDERDSTAPH